MGSLGLLIPALGGYLFLVRFNGTRDRIGRQSGYHVVFKAALIGVALFAVARLLVVLVNGGFPVVGAWWKKAIDVQYFNVLGWSPSLNVCSREPRCTRNQARQL